MAYKVGDEVVQVVKPISGPIKDMGIADGQVVYLIEWTDADGVSHARWFTEAELLPAPTPAPVQQG